MSHLVKFNSEYYKEINWSGIVNLNYREYVLAKDGWILLPMPMCGSRDLHLLMPRMSGCISVDDLVFIKHQYLNECGFSVARFGENDISQVHKTTHYLNVCASIGQAGLDCVKNILHYLYEHLSQRESNGIKLIQHESVQLSIAEIVCHIESVLTLLRLDREIDAVSFAFDYLLKATQLLTELGGGRSVLQGNSVELAFHLNLFQSIFLRH